MFAREGEVDNMLKCIDNGSSVNLKGGFVAIFFNIIVACWITREYCS